MSEPHPEKDSPAPFHFLEDGDLSPSQQAEVLRLAADYKSGEETGRPLEGRSVAVVFEKPSTRTRVSFEVAVRQLGAHPVMIDAQTTQLGRGETIGDLGKVLSRYVDAIVLRTFEDDRIAELAEGAGVPVVNALTDGWHPCQTLADLQTVAENRPLAGTRLAYLGDGSNNVAASLLVAGTTAGIEVTVCGPEDQAPAPAVVARAEAIAARTGGAVHITSDIETAATGAHVLYTDVWSSMGQATSPEQLANLRNYQLNEQVLAIAPEAVVLHCLPAHRGEEITDEVIDGPSSRVFDQAENRLHAQKALLTYLTGER
ncbi:ornithine carbamoyltransferase [Salininema proteolyticum]|uniref:Ornithine carbamoyltransferase n=1 Tax=Salininema proteolyticum TaxID=1607685 RepID=A0ABV8U479_9ACTN